MSIQDKQTTQATLLLVDDDPAFLKTLARSMSRLGYLVWPERTVAGGLQAVNTLKPDFAVVDLHLDRHSGLDLVARISEVSPQTCTLVLSGYATVRDAAAAVRAGAADCMAKPVDAQELHTALVSARSGRTELPQRFMHPDEARMQHILDRWMKSGWNTTRAADELGLHRRSLQRMLQRAGFNRKDDRPSLFHGTSGMARRFPGLAQYWSEALASKRG